MKNKLLLLLSLITVSGFSQNAPINFETSGNGATWNWITFENGANAPLQIVANPSVSGINTSSTVAKLTTLSTGAPFAGVESVHQLSVPSGPSAFGTYSITASNCTVKIMVYKSVISDVGIKFVNPTNGSTGEIKKSNSVINQWEELIFDFSSKIGETNDQIVIFPDFQTRTTDNICYFDNITFGPEIEKPNLPLDFESGTITYSFSNFGNAVTTKIPNPQSNGINTSSNVAKLIKNAGTTWAGSFIELANAVDFSVVNSIKMKVFSPYAGKTFKLKLENLTNAAFNIEVDAVNTTANAWEELTFVFPNVVNANNYKRVVVFCNFGAVGTGETYYFDDIKLNTNLSASTFDLESVKLYPNPCADLLTIQVATPISNCLLYNSLGQVVNRFDVNTNEYTFNLSHLDAGIYYLNFMVNDELFTKKVIKK
jgi:hypothetical protein